MTDAPWCDFMDLPKAQCSHCTGADARIAAEEKAAKAQRAEYAGRATIAFHDGTCRCGCGESYDEGTEIAHNGDGWCIASHVSDVPTRPSQSEVWEGFNL